MFFLTPKEQVEYLYYDFSVRQALEKMEFHRYSSIPIINRKGQYVGTLTEGDILMYIKKRNSYSIEECQETPLSKVPRYHNNIPVDINVNMNDLLTKASVQNFIPVIDDSGSFIGIITRKSIIQYCYDQLFKHQ